MYWMSIDAGLERLSVWGQCCVFPSFVVWVDLGVGSLNGYPGASDCIFYDSDSCNLY